MTLLKRVRCQICSRSFDITALTLIEINNMINGEGCIYCLGKWNNNKTFILKG